MAACDGDPSRADWPRWARSAFDLCNLRTVLLPPLSAWSEVQQGTTIERRHDKTIEQASETAEAHFCEAKARTGHAIWRAINDICDPFQSQDCWNYLKAAGRASV